MYTLGSFSPFLPVGFGASTTRGLLPRLTTGEGRTREVGGEGRGRGTAQRSLSCGDRVLKEQMEDPDDNDKTAAELACVLETPEPPPFLATWVTRG